MSRLSDWTEHYQSVKDLPEDVVRWKCEIACGGGYIGWISSYRDLDYLEGTVAIGLDILERKMSQNFD